MFGAIIPTAGAQNPPTILSYKSECANIKDNAGWGQIGLPEFGTGEQQVASYSVDAWNKKRLFVTNGYEVFRSMDGGCSWTKVYSLPAVPTKADDYSAADSRIQQVAVPEGTTSDRYVYLVVDQYRAPQDVARGARTRVLRSENNGDSWVMADGQAPELLPPHGAPEQLLPSPSFPEVLYLLMESPDVQYLATSPDGGKTWEAAGPVCLLPVLPEIDPPVEGVGDNPGPGCIDPDKKNSNAPAPGDTSGIEVDPFQPHDLWYYGPRGLERSLNSGKSPKPVVEVSEGIGALDIFRVAGQDSRIVAAGSQAPTLYVSQDGGRSWETESAPGFVQSIAKGRTAMEYFMATDQSVFMSVNGFQLDVGPVDDRQIGDIQSARTLGGTEGLCLFGSGGSHLEVACATTLPQPPPPGPGPNINIDPSKLPNTEAARFIPEGYVTKLGKGEAEVVPYKLRLFKSPTPLDVYFLIDISGSMQNPIDGVARGMQDIINELTKSKINTNFGVGVYRAYDDAPAYKRRLKVAPPSEELERVLSNLIANGGGDETQLASLYQSATGAGQDSPTNGLGIDKLRAKIDPNQEAGFRDEALKVIIHATDEPFSTLPPNPTFDEVITALNDKGVEQIGLAIQPKKDGGSADDVVQQTPRSGLLRVAEGTNTSAVGDVDCNGDGEPDIEPGAPLVCDIHPDRAYKSALMAGAVVQLLNSVEDIGEVTVSVDAPPGVVPNIESKVFTGVDFKNPPDLPFDVMFTCPATAEPKKHTVTFNATTPGFLLAQTTATVDCTVPEVIKDDPKPPKKIIPEEPEEPALLDTPIAGFFPIPAFIPPVVRFPEGSPNPGPNSQTQAQSQSQAQMQGALGKQKQEQVQLALAYSQSLKAELAAEQAGDDLNMSKYRSTSSRRQETVPPGLILMLSASAMSMAFGLHAKKRFRTQTAQARRNRRIR